MAKATEVAGNGNGKHAITPDTAQSGKGIQPPKFKVVHVPIKQMDGSALVVSRFSDKARQTMIDTQKEGSLGNKRKAKTPKDFDAAYEGARHISMQGWDGVAAATFRHAMIDACRLVGFKMVVAKLALFIEPDGLSRGDGLPLVHIHGTPEPFDIPVRNASGVADIRRRPRWHEWSATVRVRFDAELFKEIEVVNLLMRAGMQCGICEGRPSSTMSNGMDWGLFEIDRSKPIRLMDLDIPALVFDHMEYDERKKMAAE